MAQKAGSLSVIHSMFMVFKAKALFEVPAHVLGGYWQNSASCIVVPKSPDSVL